MQEWTGVYLYMFCWNTRRFGAEDACELVLERDLLDREVPKEGGALTPVRYFLDRSLPEQSTSQGILIAYQMDGP